MTTDTTGQVEILPDLRDKNVDDLASAVPEEIRGKTPDELERYLEVLDAHLRSIHQTDTGELRDKTPAERKAFDYGVRLRDIIVSRIEEHRAVQEVFRRRPKAVQSAMLNLGHNQDDAYGDVRRMNVAEARDRALRLLDDRNSSAHLKPEEKDEVEKQIRTSTDIARRILVTENEDYRNAFLKLVTKPNGVMYLTDDERRAMMAFDEYRIGAEGATGTGGAGIPVFIDPSIIMTAQGSGNPFLQICSISDVNTNAWKGVTSAGVTWAFQAENAEVADNMPTLAQPAVTVFMARGMIPYSIEVGMDYPNFASEMQRLLAEGYDELLVDKFTRGNGTTEPQGVLTVLSATAGNRVQVTSVGGVTGGDPYKLWKALPQRFRRKASWLMSVDVNNAIRQLGTANVFHAYTENLPAEWADQLFGKQTYESPYMPDTTTNTSNAGVAIVGDFQNYKIARRGGMSVEQIPRLFHTSSNFPSGTRALFAYARIGGGVINSAGFRLLVNSG